MSQSRKVWLFETGDVVDETDGWSDIHFLTLPTVGYLIQATILFTLGHD